MFDLKFSKFMKNFLQVSQYKELFRGIKNYFRFQILKIRFSNPLKFHAFGILNISFFQRYILFAHYCWIVLPFSSYLQYYFFFIFLHFTVDVKVNHRYKPKWLECKECFLKRKDNSMTRIYKLVTFLGSFRSSEGTSKVKQCFSAKW